MGAGILGGTGAGTSGLAAGGGAHAVAGEGARGTGETEQEELVRALRASRATAGAGAADERLPWSVGALPGLAGARWQTARDRWDVFGVGLHRHDRRAGDPHGGRVLVECSYRFAERHDYLRAVVDAAVQPRGFPGSWLPVLLCRRPRWFPSPYLLRRVVGCRPVVDRDRGLVGPRVLLGVDGPESAPRAACAAPGASSPVGTLAGDEARFTVALAVEGGGGEPAPASRFRSGT